MRGMVYHHKNKMSPLAGDGRDEDEWKNNNNKTYVESDPKCQMCVINTLYSLCMLGKHTYTHHFYAPKIYSMFWFSVISECSVFSFTLSAYPRIRFFGRVNFSSVFVRPLNATASRRERMAHQRNFSGKFMWIGNEYIWLNIIRLLYTLRFILFFYARATFFPSSLIFVGFYVSLFLHYSYGSHAIIANACCMDFHVRRVTRNV